MPGGRLNQKDREIIAEGLADGLGYAEIARRLGRPTSTISREVGRNGGPGRYRAEHAHEATAGRRTRRRKPVPEKEPPATADAYGRDPEAVQGFVEQLASLMVQTGMPRMAARVLTCLVTTDSGTLTASELVARLRVSPASVSKAVGYLDGLDLIRRERDERLRRERYLIDDDMWLRTWLNSAQTNAWWAEAAARGAEIFATNTPAGARLAAMGEFFAQLSEDMSGGPAGHADMLTVLAALLVAGVPLTVDQLADALDWPADRVTDALRLAEKHPDLADPVTLEYTEPGRYAITARTERLTAQQLERLTQ
jgi:hypothetical protein